MKKIFLSLMILSLLFVGCGSNESNDSTENAPSEIKKEEINLPTAVNTYVQLGQNESMPFEVSDQNIEFIKEHQDFFPGSDKNRGAISDFVDSQAGYPQLKKNINKYEGKLAFVGGEVIDIEESEDGNLTYIHIVDEINYGNYVLYYLGSLEEVFEGDYVQAYFLPFDTVTFENLSNTYTEAIVGGAALVGFLES